LDKTADDANADRVSEHDVRIAYQLLLGRLPENEQVVRDHVRISRNLAALRKLFLQSHEFRAGIGATLGARPLDWPPIAVDLDASPEAIKRLFEHIEANWSELGRKEPHWSVLTDERFKSAALFENDNENITAFYRSGHHAVGSFEIMAKRAGIDFSKYQRVFELGCGVGRVTAVLAEKFPSVCAADISAPHLRIAAEQLSGRVADGRVEWLQLKSPRDLLAVKPFDVFYSIIVLQHNPPPLMKFLLESILSKLRSGGIAYFQLPTYALGYSFNTKDYLQKARSAAKIEMHVLPQPRLWQLLHDAKCDLLEVREDTAAGDRFFISNTILARKR
jgi:SAM-dependent methyltransferase